MIEIEERPGTRPLCPHCENEIDRLCLQEVRSTLGKRYAYFCPNCRKLLGVSHRKGFWMG